MKKLSFLLICCLISLTASAQNIDLKNGLVGYWPFNGNANDESGNDNHGTAYNAILTSDRNGNPNSAYSFDGYSSKIVVPSSYSLDISSNAMTIAYWMNWSNNDRNYIGISKGGVDVGNGYELVLRGTYGGDNGCFSVSIGSKHLDVTNSNKYRNAWTHIVGTFNNGTAKLFINGVMVSQSSSIGTNTTVKSNHSLFIGVRDPSNNYAGKLKGYIDDVRIYNRALNEAEIQALYTESDKNPKLEISNLILENLKGNNSIGTYQSATLRFKISNNGKGDAKGVEVKVSETNYISGLDFASSKLIGDMNIGNQQEIMIPVKALKGLTGGNANFSVQLLEKNGFNSTKKTLSVATKAVKSLTEEIKMYVESKINEWQLKGEFEKSADYKLRVNETTRASKIDEFQNEAVNQFKKDFISTIIPKEISLGTYDADNESYLLSSSQLGEFVVPVPIVDAPVFKQNFSASKYQNFDFFIRDDNFVLSHVEVIAINNKKYTFDSKNKSAYALTNIDYKFDEIQVDVEDKTGANNIQKTTNTISVGKSDADLNIPVASVKNPHIYALIIGNEDYSSYQTGLNSEVNVDYAVNDADVFAKYVQTTLGAEKEKVKFISNATYGKMKQGLTWLSENARLDNGNAEIIFYYSGHGLPDEETKDAYLIPVDISGSNVRDGIKLDGVIAEIAAVPSKRATLFIDACFSGGARNKELLAMKGVKFKAQPNYMQGKLVMFSSSSGEESSGVYRDKQHGFFTYFLLKKLQESKGDVNYLDLGKYLKEQVLQKTTLISKPQTPQVQYSKEVENEWGGWKMK